MTLINFALILGMIFGAVMITVVVYIFFKHQKFNFGSSLIMIIGVLLLGLSVFKTVTIGINPKGGIEARFEALDRKISEVKDTNIQIRNETKESIDEIKSKIGISILKREFKEPYKAETDGFVIAQIDSNSHGNTHGILCGYAGKEETNLISPGNIRSTTSMQIKGGSPNGIYLPHSSFTMPVVKNEWWVISSCSANDQYPFATKILWVPFMKE